METGDDSRTTASLTDVRAGGGGEVDAAAPAVVRLRRSGVRGPRPHSWAGVGIGTSRLLAPDAMQVMHSDLQSTVESSLVPEEDDGGISFRAGSQSPTDATLAADPSRVKRVSPEGEVQATKVVPCTTATGGYQRGGTAAVATIHLAKVDSLQVEVIEPSARSFPSFKLRESEESLHSSNTEKDSSVGEESSSKKPKDRERSKEGVRQEKGSTDRVDKSGRTKGSKDSGKKSVSRSTSRESGRERSRSASTDKTGKKHDGSSKKSKGAWKQSSDDVEMADDSKSKTIKRTHSKSAQDTTSGNATAPTDGGTKTKKKKGDDITVDIYVPSSGVVAGLDQMETGAEEDALTGGGDTALTSPTRSVSSSGSADEVLYADREAGMRVIRRGKKPEEPEDPRLRDNEQYIVVHKLPDGSLHSNIGVSMTVPTMGVVTSTPAPMEVDTKTQQPSGTTSSSLSPDSIDGEEDYPDSLEGELDRPDGPRSPGQQQADDLTRAYAAQLQGQLDAEEHFSHDSLDEEGSPEPCTRGSTPSVAGSQGPFMASGTFTGPVSPSESHEGTISIGSGSYQGTMSPSGTDEGACTSDIPQGLPAMADESDDVEGGFRLIPPLVGIGQAILQASDPAAGLYFTQQQHNTPLVDDTKEGPMSIAQPSEAHSGSGTQSVVESQAVQTAQSSSGEGLVSMVQGQQLSADSRLSSLFPGQQSAAHLTGELRCTNSHAGPLTSHSHEPTRPNQAHGMTSSTQTEPPAADKEQTTVTAAAILDEEPGIVGEPSEEGNLTTASSSVTKKNGRKPRRASRQHQHPPTESESDVTGGNMTDDSLMSGGKSKSSSRPTSGTSRRRPRPRTTAKHHDSKRPRTTAGAVGLSSEEYVTSESSHDSAASSAGDSLSAGSGDEGDVIPREVVEEVPMEEVVSMRQGIDSMTEALRGQEAGRDDHVTRLHPGSDRDQGIGAREGTSAEEHEEVGVHESMDTVDSRKESSQDSDVAAQTGEEVTASSGHKHLIASQDQEMQIGQSELQRDDQELVHDEQRSIDSRNEDIDEGSTQSSMTGAVVGDFTNVITDLGSDGVHGKQSSDNHPSSGSDSGDSASKMGTGNGDGKGSDKKDTNILEQQEMDSGLKAVSADGDDEEGEEVGRPQEEDVSEQEAAASSATHTIRGVFTTSASALTTSRLSMCRVETWHNDAQAKDAESEEDKVYVSVMSQASTDNGVTPALGGNVPTKPVIERHLQSVRMDSWSNVVTGQQGAVMDNVVASGVSARVPDAVYQISAAGACVFLPTDPAKDASKCEDSVMRDESEDSQEPNSIEQDSDFVTNEDMESLDSSATLVPSESSFLSTNSGEADGNEDQQSTQVSDKASDQLQSNSKDTQRLPDGNSENLTQRGKDILEDRENPQPKSDIDTDLVDKDTMQTNKSQTQVDQGEIDLASPSTEDIDDPGYSSLMSSGRTVDSSLVSPIYGNVEISGIPSSRDSELLRHEAPSDKADVEKLKSSNDGKNSSEVDVESSASTTHQVAEGVEESNISNKQQIEYQSPSHGADDSMHSMDIDMKTKEGKDQCDSSNIGSVGNLPVYTTAGSTEHSKNTEYISVSASSPKHKDEHFEMVSSEDSSGQSSDMENVCHQPHVRKTSQQEQSVQTTESTDDNIDISNGKEATRPLYLETNPDVLQNQQVIDVHQVTMSPKNISDDDTRSPGKTSGSGGDSGIDTTDTSSPFESPKKRTKRDSGYSSHPHSESRGVDPGASDGTTATSEEEWLERSDSGSVFSRQSSLDSLSKSRDGKSKEWREGSLSPSAIPEDSQEEMSTSPEISNNNNVPKYGQVGVVMPIDGDETQELKEDQGDLAKSTGNAEKGYLEAVPAISHDAGQDDAKVLNETKVVECDVVQVQGDEVENMEVVEEALQYQVHEAVNSQEIVSDAFAGTSNEKDVPIAKESISMDLEGSESDNIGANNHHQSTDSHKPTDEESHIDDQIEDVKFDESSITDGSERDVDSSNKNVDGSNESNPEGEQHKAEKSSNDASFADEANDNNPSLESLRTDGNSPKSSTGEPSVETTTTDDSENKTSGVVDSIDSMQPVQDDAKKGAGDKGELSSLPNDEESESKPPEDHSSTSSSGETAKEAKTKRVDDITIEESSNVEEDAASKSSMHKSSSDTQLTHENEYKAPSSDGNSSTNEHDLEESGEGKMPDSIVTSASEPDIAEIGSSMETETTNNSAMGVPQSSGDLAKHKPDDEQVTADQSSTIRIPSPDSESKEANPEHSQENKSTSPEISNDNNVSPIMPKYGQEGVVVPIEGDETQELKEDQGDLAKSTGNAEKGYLEAVPAISHDAGQDDAKVLNETKVVECDVVQVQGDEVEDMEVVEEALQHQVHGAVNSQEIVTSDGLGGTSNEKDVPISDVYQESKESISMDLEGSESCESGTNNHNQSANSRKSADEESHMDDQIEEVKYDESSVVDGSERDKDLSNKRDDGHESNSQCEQQKSEPSVKTSTTDASDDSENETSGAVDSKGSMQPGQDDASKISDDKGEMSSPSDAESESKPPEDHSSTSSKGETTKEAQTETVDDITIEKSSNIEESEIKTTDQDTASKSSMPSSDTQLPHENEPKAPPSDSNSSTNECDVEESGEGKMADSKVTSASEQDIGKASGSSMETETTNSSTVGVPQSSGDFAEHKPDDEQVTADQSSTIRIPSHDSGSEEETTSENEKKMSPPPSNIDVDEEHNDLTEKSISDETNSTLEQSFEGITSSTNASGQQDTQGSPIANDVDGSPAEAHTCSTGAVGRNLPTESPPNEGDANVSSDQTDRELNIQPSRGECNNNEPMDIVPVEGDASSEISSSHQDSTDTQQSMSEAQPKPTQGDDGALQESAAPKILPVDGHSTMDVDSNNTTQTTIPIVDDLESSSSVVDAPHASERTIESTQYTTVPENSESRKTITQSEDDLFQETQAEEDNNESRSNVTHIDSSSVDKAASLSKDELSMQIDSVEDEDASKGSIPNTTDSVKDSTSSSVSEVTDGTAKTSQPADSSMEIAASETNDAKSLTNQAPNDGDSQSDNITSISTDNPPIVDDVASNRYPNTDNTKSDGATLGDVSQNIDQDGDCPETSGAVKCSSDIDSSMETYPTDDTQESSSDMNVDISVTAVNENATCENGSNSERVEIIDDTKKTKQSDSSVEVPLDVAQVDSEHNEDTTEDSLEVTAPPVIDDDTSMENISTDSNTADNNSKEKDLGNDANVKTDGIHALDDSTDKTKNNLDFDKYQDVDGSKSETSIDASDAEFPVETASSNPGVDHSMREESITGEEQPAVSRTASGEIVSSESQSVDNSNTDTEDPDKSDSLIRESSDDQVNTNDNQECSDVKDEDKIPTDSNNVMITEDRERSDSNAQSSELESPVDNVYTPPWSARSGNASLDLDDFTDVTDLDSDLALTDEMSRSQIERIWRKVMQQGSIDSDAENKQDDNETFDQNKKTSDGNKTSITDEDVDSIDPQKSRIAEALSQSQSVNESTTNKPDFPHTEGDTSELAAGIGGNDYNGSDPSQADSNSKEPGSGRSPMITPTPSAVDIDHLSGNGSNERFTCKNDTENGNKGIDDGNLLLEDPTCKSDQQQIDNSLLEHAPTTNDTSGNGDQSIEKSKDLDSASNESDAASRGHIDRGVSDVNKEQSNADNEANSSELLGQDSVSSGQVHSNKSVSLQPDTEVTDRLPSDTEANKTSESYQTGLDDRLAGETSSNNLNQPVEQGEQSSNSANNNEGADTLMDIEQGAFDNNKQAPINDTANDPVTLEREHSKDSNVQPHSTAGNQGDTIVGSQQEYRADNIDPDQPSEITGVKDSIVSSETSAEGSDLDKSAIDIVSTDPSSTSRGIRCETGGLIQGQVGEKSDNINVDSDVKNGADSSAQPSVDVDSNLEMEVDVRDRCVPSGADSPDPGAMDIDDQFYNGKGVKRPGPDSSSSSDDEQHKSAKPPRKHGQAHRDQGGPGDLDSKLCVSTATDLSFDEGYGTSVFSPRESERFDDTLDNSRNDSVLLDPLELSGASAAMAADLGDLKPDDQSVPDNNGNHLRPISKEDRSKSENHVSSSSRFDDYTGQHDTPPQSPRYRARSESELRAGVMEPSLQPAGSTSSSLRKSTLHLMNEDDEMLFGPMDGIESQNGEGVDHGSFEVVHFKAPEPRPKKKKKRQSNAANLSVSGTTMLNDSELDLMEAEIEKDGTQYKTSKASKTEEQAEEKDRDESIDNRDESIDKPNSNDVVDQQQTNGLQNPIFKTNDDETALENNISEEVGNEDEEGAHSAEDGDIDELESALPNKFPKLKHQDSNLSTMVQISAEDEHSEDELDAEIAELDGQPEPGEDVPSSIDDGSLQLPVVQQPMKKSSSMVANAPDSDHELDDDEIELSQELDKLDDDVKFRIGDGNEDDNTDHFTQSPKQANQDDGKKHDSDNDPDISEEDIKRYLGIDNEAQEDIHEAETDPSAAMDQIMNELLREGASSTDREMLEKIEALERERREALMTEDDQQVSQENEQDQMDSSAENAEPDHAGGLSTRLGGAGASSTSLDSLTESPTTVIDLSAAPTQPAAVMPQVPASPLPSPESPSSQPQPADLPPPPGSTSAPGSSTHRKPADFKDTRIIGFDVEPLPQRGNDRRSPSPDLSEATHDLVLGTAATLKVLPGGGGAKLDQDYQVVGLQPLTPPGQTARGRLVLAEQPQHPQQAALRHAAIQIKVQPWEEKPRQPGDRMPVKESQVVEVVDYDAKEPEDRPLPQRNARGLIARIPIEVIDSSQRTGKENMEDEHEDSKEDNENRPVDVTEPADIASGISEAAGGISSDTSTTDAVEKSANRTDEIATSGEDSNRETDSSEDSNQASVSSKKTQEKKDESQEVHSSSDESVEKGHDQHNSSEDIADDLSKDVDVSEGENLGKPLSESEAEAITITITEAKDLVSPDQSTRDSASRYKSESLETTETLTVQSDNTEGSSEDDRGKSGGSSSVDTVIDTKSQSVTNKSEKSESTYNDGDKEDDIQHGEKLSKSTDTDNNDKKSPRREKSLNISGQDEDDFDLRTSPRRERSATVGSEGRTRTMQLDEKQEMMGKMTESMKELVGSQGEMMEDLLPTFKDLTVTESQDAARGDDSSSENDNNVDDYTNEDDLDLDNRASPDTGSMDIMRQLEILNREKRALEGENSNSEEDYSESGDRMFISGDSSPSGEINNAQLKAPASDVWGSQDAHIDHNRPLSPGEIGDLSVSYSASSSSTDISELIEHGHGRFDSMAWIEAVSDMPEVVDDSVNELREQWMNRFYNFPFHSLSTTDIEVGNERWVKDQRSHSIDCGTLQCEIERHGSTDSFTYVFMTHSLSEDRVGQTQSERDQSHKLSAISEPMCAKDHPHMDDLIPLTERSVSADVLALPKESELGMRQRSRSLDESKFSEIDNEPELTPETVFNSMPGSPPSEEEDSSSLPVNEATPVTSLPPDGSATVTVKLADGQEVVVKKRQKKYVDKSKRVSWGDRSEGDQHENKSVSKGSNDTLCPEENSSAGSTPNNGSKRPSMLEVSIQTSGSLEEVQKAGTVQEVEPSKAVCEMETQTEAISSQVDSAAGDSTENLAQGRTLASAHSVETIDTQTSPIPFDDEGYAKVDRYLSEERDIDTSEVSEGYNETTALLEQALATLRRGMGSQTEISIVDINEPVEGTSIPVHHLESDAAQTRISAVSPVQNLDTEGVDLTKIAKEIGEAREKIASAASAAVIPADSDSSVQRDDISARPWWTPQLSEISTQTEESAEEIASSIGIDVNEFESSPQFSTSNQQSFNMTPSTGNVTKESSGEMKLSLSKEAKEQGSQIIGPTRKIEIDIMIDAEDLQSPDQTVIGETADIPLHTSSPTPEENDNDSQDQGARSRPVGHVTGVEKPSSNSFLPTTIPSYSEQQRSDIEHWKSELDVATQAATTSTQTGSSPAELLHREASSQPNLTSIGMDQPPIWVPIGGGQYILSHPGSIRGSLMSLDGSNREAPRSIETQTYPQVRVIETQTQDERRVIETQTSHALGVDSSDTQTENRAASPIAIQTETERTQTQELVDTGVNPSPPRYSPIEFDDGFEFSANVERAESPEANQSIHVIAEPTDASVVPKESALESIDATPASNNSLSIAIQAGRSMLSYYDVSLSSDEEELFPPEFAKNKDKSSEKKEERKPRSTSDLSTDSAPEYNFNDPKLAELRKEHERLMALFAKSKTDREDSIKKRKDIKKKKPEFSADQLGSSVSVSSLASESGDNWLSSSDADLDASNTRQPLNASDNGETENVMSDDETRSERTIREVEIERITRIRMEESQTHTSTNIDSAVAVQDQQEHTQPERTEPDYVKDKAKDEDRMEDNALGEILTTETSLDLGELSIVTEESAEDPSQEQLVSNRSRTDSNPPTDTLLLEFQVLPGAKVSEEDIPNEAEIIASAPEVQQPLEDSVNHEISETRETLASSVEKNAESDAEVENNALDKPTKNSQHRDSTSDTIDQIEKEIISNVNNEDLPQTTDLDITENSKGVDDGSKETTTLAEDEIISDSVGNTDEDLDSNRNTLLKTNDDDTVIKQSVNDEYTKTDLQESNEEENGLISNDSVQQHEEGFSKNDKDEITDKEDTEDEIMKRTKELLAESEKQAAKEMGLDDEQTSNADSTTQSAQISAQGSTPLSSMNESLLADREVEALMKEDVKSINKETSENKKETANDDKQEESTEEKIDVEEILRKAMERSKETGRPPRPQSKETPTDKVKQRPRSRTTSTQYDDADSLPGSLERPASRAASVSTQWDEDDLNVLSPVPKDQDQAQLRSQEEQDRKKSAKDGSQNRTSSPVRNQESQDISSIIERYKTIKRLVEGGNLEGVERSANRTLSTSSTQYDNEETTKRPSEEKESALISRSKGVSFGTSTDDLSIITETDISLARSPLPHRRNRSADSVSVSSLGRAHSPANSEMRDESIGTDFTFTEYDDELERLRRERQRILDMLSKDVIPSKFQVELAEAQLNYIIGQTDILLHNLDEPTWDFDQVKLLQYTTPEEGLSQVSKEYLAKYRATLEMSKEEIDQKILRLEKKRESFKKKKMFAKYQREAAKEAFKYERQREMNAYEKAKYLSSTSKGSSTSMRSLSESPNRSISSVEERSQSPEDVPNAPIFARFLTAKQRQSYLVKKRKGLLKTTKKEEEKHQQQKTDSTANLSLSSSSLLSSSPQRSHTPEHTYSLSAAYTSPYLAQRPTLDLYGVTSTSSQQHTQQSFGRGRTPYRTPRFESPLLTRSSAMTYRSGAGGQRDDTDSHSVTSSLDEDSALLLGDAVQARNQSKSEIERAREELDNKYKLTPASSNRSAYLSPTLSRRGDLSASYTPYISAHTAAPASSLDREQRQRIQRMERVSSPAERSPSEQRSRPKDAGTKPGYVILKNAPVNLKKLEIDQEIEALKRKYGMMSASSRQPQQAAASSPRQQTAATAAGRSQSSPSSYQRMTNPSAMTSSAIRSSTAATYDFSPARTPPAAASTARSSTRQRTTSDFSVTATQLSRGYSGVTRAGRERSLTDYGTSVGQLAAARDRTPLGRDGARTSDKQQQHDQRGNKY